MVVREPSGSLLAAVILLALVPACAVYEESLLRAEVSRVSGGSSAVGTAGSAVGTAGSAFGTAGASVSPPMHGGQGGGGHAGGGGGQAFGGAGIDPMGGAPPSCDESCCDDTDSDGDGTNDCEDECPDDALKTREGECGCHVPEGNTQEKASCTGLKDALRHRYDFLGDGTVLLDRVGAAHGMIEGAALTPAVPGEVDLSGSLEGPYVDLPNGLVSKLHEVTVEAWVTWRGGGAWQRVFDFGSSTAMPPENAQARGKSYLFLCVVTAPLDGQRLRAGFLPRDSSVEQRLDSVQAMPRQRVSHLALSASESRDELVLYLNGVKDSSAPFTGALAGIDDVNVWLGRSQFVNDEELNGAIHELRIYGAALSPQQIASSFAGGTDPRWLEREPP